MEINCGMDKGQGGGGWGGGGAILAGKKLNRSGLKYSHLSNGQLRLKCNPAPHTLQAVQ
jgi:hypothetical protein